MAEDQAKPMEVEEGAPQPAEGAPLPQIGLSLLTTIKTAQAQNGLKHGDYMRYRHHCATKLQTLYKVLKMQHGRSKYVKRKLVVNNITDVKHLHIPLFNAERAWAYAMELKHQAEQGGTGAGSSGAGGGVDLRKRNHLKRRLSKAVVWANELARHAAERCDARGALEAEAYACWMAGNLQLEKEVDWELGLAKFTRAKKLWQELAKAAADHDTQAQYLAAVEEIEPAARFCSYSIARAGGSVPADPELLALADPEALQGRSGMELLQSKLAALAQEARTAQAASTSYMEWLGSSHPVRHERVKLSLHQAAEMAEQLGQLMEGDDVIDARLALYDKAINALAEAKSHVRNAIKALTGNDSESQFQELQALEGAVEGLRLQRAVERSCALVANTRARFVAGLQRLAAGKKIKDKERYARPEEVVRVLELLVRHLEDLADLGVRLGGRAGEQLHDQCMARVSAARAVRCYHVAHTLLAQPDKQLEAWALFGRAQQRAAEAADKLQELPSGLPPQAGASVAEDLADMKAVGEQAGAYRSVAQAELAAEAAKAQEEVAAGVSSLSLEQQAAAAASGNTPAYLLDALDKWESFAGGSGAAGAKASARLIKAPYAYAPVTLRPIMLDTASGCLGYPSLEHRLRKEEKKSMLSSFFGLGSWRK